MTNRDKLIELLADVFLLEPSQIHFDLRREDVDTWDSLGVVSLAVGLHQTFGYHFTPEEALALKSVRDIIHVLSLHGIDIDA